LGEARELRTRRGLDWTLKICGTVDQKEVRRGWESAVVSVRGELDL
jgi:hypothetical protein